MPTPLPTPVVTPIPYASPPFIPELAAVEPQPFQVFVREGNQLWLVNSDGSGKRLLLDTEQELGLYLDHELGEGYRPGESAASPDGRYVALVLNDTWEREPGKMWHYYLYLLEIGSGKLTSLGEAMAPTWSRDGSTLAYVRFLEDKAHLFVLELESGKETEVYQTIMPRAVTAKSWSHDG